MHKKWTVLIFILNAAYAMGQAPLQTDSLSLSELKPSAANCAIYQANSYWLPDAYIYNARCACMKTPDEPKANRIRMIVQQRLTMTPEAVKQVAAEKKTLYQQKLLSKRNYRHFLKRTLAPIIYADHIIAYKIAGCEGNPAAFRAWKKISVTRVKNCNNIWRGIKNLGACNCGSCQW